MAKDYKAQVIEAGETSGVTIRCCAANLYDLATQVKAEFGGEKAQIEMHVLTIESCKHQEGKIK